MQLPETLGDIENLTKEDAIRFAEYLLKKENNLDQVRERVAKTIRELEQIAYDLEGFLYELED